MIVNNIEEVTRCLKCRNALCTKACPISTPVANVMTLYQEGNKEEAAKLLFENNPFSYICSLVCDHQRQCFGNCILNHKKVPIHFYKVEEELSKIYLENIHFNKKEKIDKSVGIIGAGPAGISAAIFLASEGIKVTIYEKFEDLGGVLRYGIPKERLNKDVLDYYKNILDELDIKIRYNVEIGKSLKLKDLSKGHDAVLLANGAWIAKSAYADNEHLANVHYAIDYLKNPTSFDLGKKVIVIGAGNVAMDAAATAKRLGYDTYIYYRKTFENMPANTVEIEEVKKMGVKFETFKAPISFKEDGCVFKNCENQVDGDNKVKTVMIENTEHFVKADSFIIATSQAVDLSFDDLGLEKTAWNTPVITNKYQTSIENIFAAGDAATGPATVVLAVKQAKEVAKTISLYLNNK